MEIDNYLTEFDNYPNLKAGFIHLIKNNHENISATIQIRCIVELIDAYKTERCRNSEEKSIEYAFQQIRSYRRFEYCNIKDSIKISLDFDRPNKINRVRIGNFYKQPKSFKKARRAPNCLFGIIVPF